MWYERDGEVYDALGVIFKRFDWVSKDQDAFGMYMKGLFCRLKVNGTLRRILNSRYCTRMLESNEYIVKYLPKIKAIQYPNT